MTKLSLIQGVLAIAFSSSIAFADTAGSVRLTPDPDGDGKLAIEINGEAATSMYNLLATPEQIADPVVERGYKRETKMKQGRDLACTYSHFQRVDNGDGDDHHFPGDWMRRRPGSYSEYNCQTRMNAEGKIGLHFDDHHDGDHHDGDHPGPH
jgi:hypothetical protein